jgi:hypothetical protein
MLGSCYFVAFACYRAPPRYAQPDLGGSRLARKPIAEIAKTYLSQQPAYLRSDAFCMVSGGSAPKRKPLRWRFG